MKKRNLIVKGIWLFAALVFLSTNAMKAQSVESTVLYPNPFYDSLFIEINLIQKDTVTIIFYGLPSGNTDTLFTDSIFYSGSNLVKIDASFLSNGMYFMKNYFKKNDVVVYRITKIDKPLFVQNLEQDNSPLLMYPNPSKGKVYFLGIELAKIEVYDINGRKVFFDITNSGYFELDTSPGFYVVQITNLKNGDIATNLIQIVE